MPYCVKADLEARATAQNVLRWADDSNNESLSATEETYITAAITKAESFINMRLDARYSVPFTTVPQEIKDICIDLSVWFLASRKGFASQGGGEEGLWKKNFDDALAMLDGLRKGELSLPGVSPRASMYSTEKDTQAALTYTKQDQVGDDIETDLENTLDDYVSPNTRRSQ